MSLPAAIAALLEDSYGTVKNFHPVFGGSINSAGRIDTGSGTYFIKWNDASAFPGMFEAEKAGLEALAATGAVHVPEVYQVFEEHGHAGLVMAYIHAGRGSASQWHTFGQALATLHAFTSDSFGLDHDNYMGSLRQTNRRHAAFPEFFIEERLNPQVRLATEQARISAADCHLFEQVFRVIEQEFSDEKPCLVHGDLWSGNVVFDQTGACLVDPAVAYSSRYVDLAMSTMFGRFPGEFYAGYGAETALRPEHTWDLLKLYPLLIHVNLFGSSYMGETRQILTHFTR